MHNVYYHIEKVVVAGSYYLCRGAFLIAVLWALVTPLSASTTTILHDFGSTTNDGIEGNSQMIQGTDGSFYGTTEGGGTANKGTVFKITAGGTMTILHNFGDGSVSNDGYYPWAGVILGTDGNFYGTTYDGGLGAGTVFKMTYAGTVTILHRFALGGGTTEPANPESALLQGTDGNFYGSSVAGGSAGLGTVYKVTPAGVVTVLHHFNDGSVSFDGFEPVGGLVQLSNGFMYGTAAAGGMNGDGVIYDVTSGGTYNIIHQFNGGSEGNLPVGTLVLGTDGKFYGTCLGGGTGGYGSIFRLSLIPFTYTTLVSGTSSSAVSSFWGGLIKGTDGNLYGTGEGGGNGTAFKMTYAGSVTVLHTFGTISNDGINPDPRMVQGTDGNFYGMTPDGGPGGYPNGKGVIYKIVP